MDRAKGELILALLSNPVISGYRASEPGEEICGIVRALSSKDVPYALKYVGPFVSPFGAERPQSHGERRKTPLCYHSRKSQTDD